MHQPTMNLDSKTVPKYIKDIQPRPTQVCNCDEIGFNPNGSWLRVVCTYKLFTGKLIWKPQTGQIPPFWCTSIIFTRDDGQCFMPPIIFHQAENYTQGLQWNLYSDWIVHNTPSVYM